LRSADSLKRFANEAEIMNNFDLATKYYLERITLSSNDASLWLEYAEFALRIKHVTRAEECLLEALTLDPKHFNR
jgi:tetratricopeptide (TPR) repeat protein